MYTKKSIVSKLIEGQIFLVLPLNDDLNPKTIFDIDQTIWVKGPKKNGKHIISHLFNSDFYIYCRGNSVVYPLIINNDDINYHNSLIDDIDSFAVDK